MAALAALVFAVESVVTVILLQIKGKNSEDVRSNGGEKVKTEIEIGIKILQAFYVHPVDAYAVIQMVVVIQVILFVTVKISPITLKLPMQFIQMAIRTSHHNPHLALTTGNRILIILKPFLHISRIMLSLDMVTHMINLKLSLMEAQYMYKDHLNTLKIQMQYHHNQWVILNLKMKVMEKISQEL